MRNSLFLVLLILAVLLFKCIALSSLECTWCVVDNNQYEEEFRGFLETVYKAECFLQVSARYVEIKGFMKLFLKVHLRRVLPVV